MFKKLLASVGVGAAEVETELFGTGVQPGGVVRGVVRLRGGQARQRVSRVGVELVTRVEVEYSDGEALGEASFAQLPLHGGFEVGPGAFLEFPFALHVPRETPITFYNGRYLPGAAIAVRTVVELDSGVDATDTDPIAVAALPAQQAVLDAILRWGFALRSTDVEAGRIAGAVQQLPFYQEIEFGPSPRFPRVNQLELTFLAADNGMNVVLEADKRGSFRAAGRDDIGTMWIDYATVGQVDWTAAIGHRLNTLASR